jgi:hypothetical protein
LAHANIILNRGYKPRVKEKNKKSGAEMHKIEKKYLLLLLVVVHVTIPRVYII